MQGLRETGDFNIKEPADDRRSSLIFVKAAGHEIFDLFAGKLPDRCLMREFGPDNRAFDLGYRIDNSVLENETFAFQMPAGTCCLSGNMATGDNGPSFGDGTGDQFCAGAFAFKDCPGPEIHIRALWTDDNAAEPGNRILSFEGGCRVHLDLFYRLHADIVGEEDPVLFDNGRTARVDFDVLAPVMDHRETDLGIFTYIEFRDTIMGSAMAYFFSARAAGDNMELSALFSNDDIMDMLDLLPAEEGAELHIITGCSSGEKVGHGAAHYGISEFYVGKNAKISFTMIHNWSEHIEVYPRSASVVEENGVFLSNYVCMQPVKKIQMYPTATLKGENSVARFSSVVICPKGSYMDLGSRAILEGKGASAELVTRAITKGGTIISRGHIAGKTAGTRGHLECKGLILKDGVIYAIPEIEGSIVGTELSHEAAVGKLAREEIEYLMSRGLDEDEATATIIRGFLDVKISGLPEALQKQIDASIDEAEKSGF